jgi:hypothetical protein
LRCGHGVRAHLCARTFSRAFHICFIDDSMATEARHVECRVYRCVIQSLIAPGCYIALLITRRHCCRQLCHLPQPHHGPLHRVPSAPAVRNLRRVHRCVVLLPDFFCVCTGCSAVNSFLAGACATMHFTFTAYRDGSRQDKSVHLVATDPFSLNPRTHAQTHSSHLNPISPPTPTRTHAQTHSARTRVRTHTHSHPTHTHTHTHTHMHKPSCFMVRTSLPSALALAFAPIATGGRHRASRLSADNRDWEFQKYGR